MSGKVVTKFQDGQHSGLIAVIACAGFSLLAIQFVWVRLVWSSLKGKNPAKVSKFMPEHVFFRTQLGAYIASLLWSNAISCIGYVMNVVWLMDGAVTSGDLCTAQGALTQVGDLSTAYFTAAIAVHTFCTLALRNRLPFYCAWVAVIAGWVITTASGLVPSFINFKSGPVYGTDGATCGISLQYPLVQLLLHLVPMLAASLIASVFYALVFLNIRGTLSIKGGVKFNLDPESRWRAQDGQVQYIKFVAAIAKTMLIFPIVYVVLLMPHIVICLVETSGWSVPFSAKVFAVACAGLLGVFNVMILYNTLRIIGPAFLERPIGEKSDVESFSSPQKSPVDVAPSVSAVMAQRAFPPPRSLVSSRQPSIASLNSTTKLIVQPGDNNTLQRSITPVEELNELIVPNAPMTPKIKVESASSASSPDTDDASLHSLPAPRRPEIRKPHLRRQGIPSAINVPAYPEYVVENGMLSAVNLQSAGTKKIESKKARDRDSFINMYTSRSPPETRLTLVNEQGMSVKVEGPSPPRRSARPSASARNFADRYDISAFTSPRNAPTPPAPRSSSTASSPDAFSARPDVSEMPLSPFASGLIERATKSPEHNRTQSDISSPSFGSMSAMAKEALVRNAANKNKRRSKSLDATPRRGIPETLRPGTPLSARAREIIPLALNNPEEFSFPQTPRTPRTPGTSYSRSRSPAPPLPSNPLPSATTSARSPPHSIRRLPKTPTDI